MEWKYVKKLINLDIISEFENMVGYNFCEAFKNCVVCYNGGRPSKKTFNTNKKTGREIKSFLSFNKDDLETVWKLYEWCKKELDNRYIPFAIDNFGNLICFEISNDNVIFINLENISIEFIANDFVSFLNKLYD